MSTSRFFLIAAVLTLVVMPLVPMDAIAQITLSTGDGAGGALFKPLIDFFQDVLDFVTGPMAVAVILVLLVLAVLLFVAGSRFEGAAGYFLRALAGAVFIANLAVIAGAIGLIG